MIRLGLALAATLLPVAAHAQSLQCAVPARVERPRADLASARQPRRIVPTGGYTLAISWSPNYCRDHARDASARFQCGAGNRFGFTLHGLWPDGVGPEWPQYCRATTLLPPRVIRTNLCATPSAQLLQHEWAKHGTCMPGYTPLRYFGRSAALYRRLRYPDMDRLSRGTLTARGLAQAMASENPGLGAGMMRVTADRRGWLDEVWICLDKSFRYRPCPVHQGGLAPTAQLRIWRGRT